jgi:hypothetical protein
MYEIISHPGVKIEPSIYTIAFYRPGSHLLFFWIVAVEVDHKLIVRPIQRAPGVVGTTLGPL